MSSSLVPKRAEGQRELHVVETLKLTANLRRVILAGRDLATLTLPPGAIGPHLKLFVPAPGTTELVWPILGPDKKQRIWPEGAARPTVRTYSVRAYDAEKHHITIDLVDHDGGVASDWARQARPGDKIGIAGPRCKLIYRGEWLLMAGDLSALPAISYTLEKALPPQAQGKVIIEVPSPDDKVTLHAPAGIDVRYLIRPPGAPSRLVETASAIAIPTDVTPLIWAAMELDLAKQLRRAIKANIDLPREQCHIVNYWREGVPEGGFSHRGDE